MSFSDSIRKCFKYTYLAEEKNTAKISVFGDYLRSLPKDFVYQNPPNIIWKITSECNLRCKHCFYYPDKKMFDNKNDMSKDEALTLARYLVDELNVMSVLLTGGEALISPYFFELLEYLKSKNVCVSLFSNGTLITKSIAKKLGEVLNYKYDNIQISLDAPMAEIHDKIRGNGSFNKTIQAINHLSDVGLSTSIACCVTSNNVNTLENFSTLFNHYNIDKLRLGRYKVFSKEQAYLEPNLKDLFVSFAKLIDKEIPVSKSFFNAYDFLKYPIGKKLFDEYNPPSKNSCNKLCHNHNKVFIAADAKLYLCTSSETAGLCLGDLRKESFEQIWEKRYEHPLFQPRVDFICKKCQYNKWCNAGCAVLAYMNSGTASSAPQECLYQYELEKYNA